MQRRHALQTLAALSAAAAVWPALAQDAWPAKSIRIVVPFAPGGTSDALARLLAPRLQEVLKQPVPATPDAAYQAAKERYNQELNLIWLVPFGFTDAQHGQAAPVARKDTLKKFPALARLLNKLGGTIDAAAMQKLEAETRSKPAPEVARAFLKAQKLI